LTPPRPIALVGVGKIARDQHLPAIAASPDWELAATVSRQARVEGVPAYRDLASLLRERPDIGVLSLCLPPQPRYDYASQALRAGRHVMLEKPPGQTLAEVHRLEAQARRTGVTLYASWHSRMGQGVAAAKAWLAGRRVTGGRIIWKEDVRQWHPGQEWVFEPGGLGVFDPGINAFSILTEILPEPVHVRAAELWLPEGRQTPIAATVEFADAIRAELDWLHPGEPIWDIEIATDEGELLLREGGGRGWAAGRELPGSGVDEYPALYARLAELVGRGQSEVDLAPMVLVEDALSLGRRQSVAPFAF
jgi:D-galactose 1-dehydrogenase